MIRLAALAVALGVAGGCATPPAFSPAGQRMAELDRAVKEQATQDVVLIGWGPPTTRTPLSVGGEVWTYRYGLLDDCVQYVLLFDSQGVLRRWQRRPHC